MIAVLLSFLAKPAGRYAAIAALCIMAGAWFYITGRADQKSADQNKGLHDVIDTAKQAQGARADARADERAHPGGLPDDPFRRD